MTGFYRFSGAALTACVMVLTASVIVQTLCVTYGLRRLRMGGVSLQANLLELLVLFHQLGLALMLAELIYQVECGFVYPGGHRAARYVVFAGLLALCWLISWRERVYWPAWVTLAAALTLPFMEALAGSAFPELFILSLGFWLVRGARLLLRRSREQRRQLTALSIKEAVDTLDSGLLFCQARGHEDGQILLQNSRMQQLMQTLTGQFQYNGKAFYEDLREGRVLPACKKGEMGQQLAYWLPDGTVWVFDLHMVRAGHSTCALLVANNATQRWMATHQLWQQNKQLGQRNRELKNVLQNLDAICRTEETIHAKSRVHDVLGQRISLLLRAMREHRQPDEVLLASFASGLPDELTEAAPTTASLSTLVEVFRGLGVQIHVEGTLPPEERLARTFYEIAAEAVTNSVRHGYAAEVWLSLRRVEGHWQLDITDSGIPPAGPVAEGGGLQGMRRRARQLGGSFAYTTSPQFHICVIVPEGEIL